GVPNKFDPDGNVQRYSGNTFICPLSPSSVPELHSSLIALYKKLKLNPLCHLYALLPPSSWHMTVFEGVCEIHQPGRWPEDLPDDASLPECTALYEKKLSTFDVECDPPYRLSVKGIDLLKSGIELRLEPYTLAEDGRIRDPRDRISTLLHIRKADHDTYGFHLMISVAYMLRFPTKEQRRELSQVLEDHFRDLPKQFELGPIEFCVFEDMYAFKLHLEDHSQK
ncbi:RNA ligase/cyclic nucleotide phosphodiesterase, partial [Favolaschia claudopus]